MTDASCYLRDDFSLLRLFTDAGEETWRAEPLKEGEQADAIWWRARAQQAAQWMADRIGPDGSIGLVLLDSRDALCAWVGAPSDDPHVVAAAMRQPDSPWEDLGADFSVQPLTDPAERAGSLLSRKYSFPLSKRARTGGATLRFPVLFLFDALVRLWLDDLDRRGVRIGTVVSLWHAIGAAWSDVPNAPAPTDGAPAEPPIEAVIISHERRLSWAWSRDRRLLVGGEIGAPSVPVEAKAPVDIFAQDERAAEEPEAPPPEPATDYDGACSRLALDWLTWSASLGAGPDRVVVIGADADAIVDALGRTWPESPARAVSEQDPALATIRVCAQSPRLFDEAVEEDPRRSLVGLSRRRGRAHARLYTWAGAAMGLLAVGIGAIGWRRYELAGNLKEESRAVAAMTLNRVQQATGARADSLFPVRSLESALQSVRQARPDFEDPAPARPILDEMERLTRVLSDLTPMGLEIDEIVMHERAPNAKVFVPDFALGEDLRERLRTSGGTIRWQVNFEAQEPGKQRWRLIGAWEEAAK